MNPQQTSGLGNVVNYFFLIPLHGWRCYRPRASTQMSSDMRGLTQLLVLLKVIYGLGGPVSANQAVTLRPSLLTEIRAEKPPTCGRALTAAELPHTHTHNDWLEPVSPTAMCFFTLSLLFSKAVLRTWSSPFQTIFQWQDDDSRGQRCETAEQKEAEEGKHLEIWGTQGPLCHGLCPHMRSEGCKRTRWKLCCFYTLKSTALAQVVTRPMTPRNN